MNPFELTGPPFLLFFAALVVAMWGIMLGLQRWNEASELPLPRLTDPYAIGYLRAGTRGVAEVALVSLCNRGLLAVLVDKFQLEPSAAFAVGATRVEQALLGLAKAGFKPTEAIRDATVCEFCASTIRAEMEAGGLMPSNSQRVARWSVFAASLGLILTVWIVRLALAAERGRHNVALLWIEMIVAGLALTITTARRRTERGTEALKSLQELFSQLKSRIISQTPEEAELTMVAAVFGAKLVPSAAGQLFVKMDAQSGSSGCGGGGCGGGGCGGCGS